MKKSSEELINELRSLCAVQNTTLKNVLFTLIELSREAEDSHKCYEDMTQGLHGLKKAKTGAFGSSSYNKAIDDSLALIEGLRGAYKDDSYR